MPEPVKEEVHESSNTPTKKTLRTKNKQQTKQTAHKQKQITNQDRSSVFSHHLTPAHSKHTAGGAHHRWAKID